MVLHLYDIKHCNMVALKYMYNLFIRETTSISPPKLENHISVLPATHVYFSLINLGHGKNKEDFKKSALASFSQLWNICYTLY